MKLTLLFLSIIICTVGCTPDIRLIKGVIWQPTLDYNTPIGSWDKIGADTILVQWTLLEKKAWLGALNHPEWTPSPRLVSNSISTLGKRNNIWFVW